jgi:hypothetical protein
MPSIGITLTEIAEPSNSTTEEFTKDQSVEIVSIRDKTGVTKHATRSATPPRRSLVGDAERAA